MMPTIDRGNTARQKLAWMLAASACIALFGFAFVAAPQSCEWGNAAYGWAGAGCLLALGTTPFALRAAPTLLRRAGFSLGLVLLGAAVWLAGGVTANFRIICRLI